MYVFCACVRVRVWAQACHSAQMKIGVTCVSWPSAFARWVPGIELESLRLAVGTFIHWTVSLAPYFKFYCIFLFRFPFILKFLIFCFITITIILLLIFWILSYINILKFGHVHHPLPSFIPRLSSWDLFLPTSPLLLWISSFDPQSLITVAFMRTGRESVTRTWGLITG